MHETVRGNFKQMRINFIILTFILVVLGIVLIKIQLKETIDKFPENFTRDELIDRLISIEKVECGKLQVKKIWTKKLRNGSNKLDKVSSRGLKKHIRLHLQRLVPMRQNSNFEIKVEN